MKQWIGGALLGAMVIVLGPGCGSTSTGVNSPAEKAKIEEKMEEMKKANQNMGPDRAGGGAPSADK